jgi:hypothetical protein
MELTVELLEKIYEYYLTCAKKPSISEIAERFMVEAKSLHQIILDQNWEVDRKKVVSQKSLEERKKLISQMAKVDVDVNQIVSENIAQMILLMQNDLPLVLTQLSERADTMAARDLIAYANLLQKFQSQFIDLVKDVSKEVEDPNDMANFEALRKRLESKQLSMKELGDIHVELNGLADITNNEAAQNLFANLDKAKKHDN